MHAKQPHCCGFGWFLSHGVDYWLHRDMYMALYVLMCNEKHTLSMIVHLDVHNAESPVHAL